MPLIQLIIISAAWMVCTSPKEMTAL